MSTVTTGDIAKFLWPGLKSVWSTDYNKYEKQCMQIFDRVSSDKMYEEYTGYVGLGLARVKPESAPVHFDKFNQGYTYRLTNVAWALGFAISREAIRDQKYQKISVARTKALASSMAQTQEIVGANILNRAFNSAYTYADGKELCATNHTTKGGVAFSNELALAADISEVAIEQALIDISDFTDEVGLKIAVRGRKIIVPTSSQFEIRRILESVGQNDTANNAKNVLKDAGLQVVVNNYLTDQDAWFIKTDVADGLIFQDRDPAEFENDTDFNAKNMLFTGYQRYAFGCPDVRGVYGSPGA